MPVEIRVPEMGESVVDATVGKWLKKEGDPVKVGEAVVGLERQCDHRRWQGSASHPPL